MRDEQGFDDFYRSTSTRMLRYGFAVTGNLDDAQDLVQEAYARAWQRWRSLAGHPSPEGWVRLTLGRLATDRWRRLGRWRAALVRSGPPEPATPAPSEDTMMLVGLLRTLPASQRQALALHYLFDLSVADIAAEMGASTGTVKSWLFRGRAGMAAAMETTALDGREPDGLREEPTHA